MTTTDRDAPRVPVHGLTPFAHVADVERSIAFYQLLGFTVARRLQDDTGRTFWARLTSGLAALMLAAAGEPVVPEQQAILFYLYCRDVASLRAHLLASGVRDGGEYRGQGGVYIRSTVFAVARPDYMPAGEVRVADPDGYVLLVGQEA